MPLSRTRSALSRFDHELDKVAADKIALEQELEVLNRYEAVLASERAKVSGLVLERAGMPHVSVQTSRTQAITDILHEAGKPIAVRDVIAEIRQRGVRSDNRSVYATLSYLRRKGVAAPVERGKWQYIPDHESARREVAA